MNVLCINMYIHYILIKKEKKPQEIRLFFAKYSIFAKKKKVLKNPYLKLFNYVF